MAITAIDSETLMQMLNEISDLQVVDVRTPEEFYGLGHIAQAQLIPLYELPYAFRTLNEKEAVVVLCQHGVRSVDACHFLHAQGFDKLYNLEEGMSAWTGPTERDLSLLAQSTAPQNPGEAP